MVREMRLVGVDLGGTNVKLAVVEDGHIVSTGQVATASEDGPDAVLARVAALAASAGPADGVGVALPGLFDEEGRAVLLPNLHGDWTGRPLAEPLAAALGAPAALVNDGHAFALAESTLGSGVGARTVMAIVCGTGVGGGLVLDGRLYLGLRERAGEFGHHTVAEDGPPCECGNHGCLELYAGARAIARATGQPTFDDALDAARDGDERAIGALARAGTLIGLAVANVAIFLAPDRIVVGGGVAAAGDLVLGPLESELRRRARVAPLEDLAVVPAALGSFAGAAGAALFAGSRTAVPA
jgi:glucokinase